jgi:5-methylcytosine-specific restriction enzyme A
MRLPFARRMQRVRELIADGKAVRGRKTWWDADHIVPVVQGGDAALDNIRTLCIACHRAETAALRKRMAKMRISVVPR